MACPSITAGAPSQDCCHGSRNYDLDDQFILDGQWLRRCLANTTTPDDSSPSNQTFRARTGVRIPTDVTPPRGVLTSQT